MECAILSFSRLLESIFANAFTHARNRGWWVGIRKTIIIRSQIMQRCNFDGVIGGYKDGAIGGGQ